MAGLFVGTMGYGNPSWPSEAVLIGPEAYCARYELPR